MNPWVVHRDRDVFGEDAEFFRPDRWLQEDTHDMSTIPCSRVLFLEQQAYKKFAQSASSLRLVLGRGCVLEKVSYASHLVTCMDCVS